MRYSWALLGCCFLVIVLLSPGAEADSSVSFYASADTSINSLDTSTSFSSDGIGLVLFSGYTRPTTSTQTTNGTRRTLIEFDLTKTTNCRDNTLGNLVNDCVIPANSQVTGVDLQLYVAKVPGGPADAVYTLHRLLKGWGEGTSKASSGGLAPATNGDATWKYEVYNATLNSRVLWSTPGGDFSGNVSATGDAGTGLGAFDFYDSTSNYIKSDIDGWINTPSSNHGWILTTPNTAYTARQIASRENSNTGWPPKLTFTYKRPAGAACDSNSDCEGSMSCTIGVCCQSSACDSAPACHTNSGAYCEGLAGKNPGTCYYPVDNTNSSGCNDNHVCTQDSCSNGSCVNTIQVGQQCRTPSSSNECEQNYCVTGNKDCPTTPLSSVSDCTIGDSNPCTLDVCDGVHLYCPFSPAPSSTSCYTATGVCDQNENCDGTTTTCPNHFKSAQTLCSNASCTNSDNDEIPPGYCTGSSASCPTQAPISCSPTKCDPSTGACSGSCATDAGCVTGDYCDTSTGTCYPKKSDGSACAQDDQCTHGHCDDSVCCATDCGKSTTDCQACNLTNSVGTCTLLGTNHTCHAARGPCETSETCQGSGSCPAFSYYGSNHLCQAASCSNGVETLAAYCSGSSYTCNVTTQKCAPYVCGSTACLTKCSSDNDCIVGDYCDSSGQCVAKKQAGATCDNGQDHECVSGHCTDSVCCNSACKGQCEACDLKRGTCEAITGQPHGNRQACTGDGSTCSGYCNGNLTTSCFYPGSTTVCRVASCSSGVATLKATCAGTGACPKKQQQICSPYACAASACFGKCSADAECASGYYCSSSSCTKKLTDGTSCGADDQCSSGFCVDGVCCDKACSGQCEACDVQNSVGTCTPVTGTPHGTRPACITDGSLCGGTCDGKLTTSCTYAGSGTVCRPASCTSGIATLEAFCTGTGACPAKVRQDCTPFQCNSAGTACEGNCTLDSDCGPTRFCAAGLCEPKRQLGQSCSSSSSCISGVCVDGYCCNEACTGQCEACDVTGSEGTCTPVSGAPHGTRPACSADGSACDGTCDGSDRTGCSYPGPGTQCRKASCTSGVATLAAYCTGSGACPAEQQQVCPSTCSAGICSGGCTTNPDCGSGKYCSAGVCVKLMPDGQPCGSNSQCSNGHCVDGFCCNTACTGQCMACDVPASQGFCAPVSGQPHGGRPTCGGSGPCGAACNGTIPAKCVFPGSETACGVGACSNGVATGLAVCNSAGTCLPPTTQDCSPYACNGPACGTSCSTSADCVRGFTCDSNGQCVAAVPDAGSDAGDSGADAGPDSSLDGSVDSSVDASAGSGGTAGAAGTTGTGGSATGGSTGSGGSATGGSAGSATGGSGGTAGGLDAGSAGAAGKNGASAGKQGGCGCRVPAGPGESSDGSWLLLLGLALVAERRRRRRKAS